ncbi:MAG: hypothetical protein ACTS8Z_01880 [Candidatus Limnocylindrales bacterium]
MDATLPRHRRSDLGWLGVRVYPVTLGIALVAVAECIALAMGLSPIIMLDWDRGHYMDAARRFLDTGTPYLASEVLAPFDYQPLTFLHPPNALYLMVPFAFLPDAAWYLVPLAIIAISLYAWQPARWAWPILALCLAWPRSQSMIVTGNTDLWVAAFVALGCRYGWPALLIGIKPSLAPVALVGVRHRSWWLALPVGIAACVPFGSLWFDWLAVVRNAPGDLLYSVLALPLILMPFIAWRVRTKPDQML